MGLADSHMTSRKVVERHRNVDTTTERLFGEEYFKRFSSRSIAKGRKPFHTRFWLRYLRRLAPKGKLLELGCGEGFFLEHAEKHYETYGVDISEYAIKRAKTRCKNTKLYVKDARNLDFKDNQFDIIVSFDMLEHLQEPGSTIRESNRILKPKGLLLTSFPNTQSLGRSWKRENWFGYRDKTHVSLLSKAMWIKLLNAAGFQVLGVFYDGLWDSPYFSGIPTIAQHFFFKFPSTLLFYLGFHIPERFGETVYMVSVKQRELY